jgi:hypothetical protein
MSNMSRKMFNQMRYSFRRKMNVQSEWVILRRLAVLAEIEPIYYDCCINSCKAYLGQFQHHEYCVYCKQPRYRKGGRSRRTFMYLPFIPRLQALFQKPEIIQKLLYRHNYKHRPGLIRDVFDAEHYRTLLCSKVKIDGVERPYKYFSGKHDIAFAISVDGYLLFKRRRHGPSATPILAQIFNFPPQIRCRLPNLFCLGLIAGPHQPKDIPSFMVPVDDECVSLAYGVSTYDPIDRCFFKLHAYGIQANGDILAITKMMGIKGHNGYCPCRNCKITGVRNITESKNTYYVPLQTPQLPHQTRCSFDPYALPPRTNEDIQSALDEIAAARTKTACKDLKTLHGINRPSALRRVGSMSPESSNPWEWMHLFCENNVPNLVKIWMGQFKGLDSGQEDYEISMEVWKEIGQETADAVKDIPASFVRVLGNIGEDRSSFTAESWAFWFIHLAPIVMRSRFKQEKYYTHMCALADIMKMTLKYEITIDEVTQLEQQIVDWVRTYERYGAPDSDVHLTYDRFIGITINTVKIDCQCVY